MPSTTAVKFPMVSWMKLRPPNAYPPAMAVPSLIVMVPPKVLFPASKTAPAPFLTQSPAPVKAPTLSTEAKTKLLCSARMGLVFSST